MDYPELIAEITDRTGDSAVATRAKLYLSLAEAQLNKELHVAESESEETLTTDADGNVDLPEDFSALRMLYSGIYELQAQSLPLTVLPRGQYPRTVYGYAVRGKKLLTNLPDSDLTLLYYAKLPPLDQTGTNWLIESDPEIYLYAMLKQAFMGKLDAEKASAAQAVLTGLIAEKIRADTLARFARKPYRVIGNVV